MRRLRPWHSARAAGLGALLALLLACGAPATRVKVLSFFFDGVPGAPNTHPKSQAHGGDDEASPYKLARARATPKPTPLPIISTHRPVAEHRCKACHESGGRFAPIEMTEQFCDKCHREEREKGGWDHGPINAGTCVPCHRAHESPYPHLLDLPQPDVCLRCHSDDLKRPIPGHQGKDVNTCTSCHDQHRRNHMKTAMVAGGAKQTMNATSGTLPQLADAGGLASNTITITSTSTENHGRAARATELTSTTNHGRAARATELTTNHGQDARATENTSTKQNYRTP